MISGFIKNENYHAHEHFLHKKNALFSASFLSANKYYFFAMNVSSSVLRFS